MSHARRVDQNQRVIVKALERLGWTVSDTSRAGSGFPDLVCSRGGITRLVEVKAPKGKLTPAQVTFRERHPVVIVRSVDDAIALS